MILFACLTILPGPILLVIYKALVDTYPEYSMSLYLQKTNVAVILATFAFTILGFLAALVTILFTFSQSKSFKKYREKGFLDQFFYNYYMTIFCLMVTFIAALLTLAGQNSLNSMLIAVAFMINNLVQIFLLTFTIINLSKKSA